MNEFVAIAIPGGETPAGVLVRLLLVPRIMDVVDGDVLHQPGLADWPRTMADTGFSVEFAKAPIEPGLACPAVARSTGDSAAWLAAFEGVPVRPPRRTSAASRLELTETSALSEEVRDVYVAAARNAGMPDAARTNTAITRLVGARGGRRGAGGSPPARDVGIEPDFHRLVALFRQHPRVLRALGLLLDLDCALLDPSAVPRSGVVSVRTALPPGAPMIQMPMTHYERVDGRFLPAPGPGSDIRRGMVALDNEKWRMATFDAISASNRLIDAVGHDGAAVDSLPALTSTGLSLLRRNRAEVLEQRRSASFSNADRAPSTLEFWADDLLLGVRVDVRSGDGPWMPTCRRDASYRIRGSWELGAPEVEEGQVTSGAVSLGAGEGGEEVLVADETVVRWGGWSLVCSPVLAAREPDSATGRSQWLTWEFAPRDLPVLRFGKTYRMRLRAVDFAGGGLELDEPELSEADTPAVFYGRHDPVLPPEMPAPPGLIDDTGHLIPDPTPVIGPNGQENILVIRSDPGNPSGPLDPLAYAAAQPYPRNDSRLLLPPSAAYSLCEVEGAFDALDDAAVADCLARATTPLTYSLDGRYSWLPDPSAEGITVAGRAAPGAPAVPRAVTAAWAVPAGRWPDFAGKTIRLKPRAEGDAVVSWEDPTTLEVRLSAGERLDTALSSSVGSIAKFAMNQWLEQEDMPAALSLEELRALVLTGRHPLVSPPRVLTCVHAVQHPLTPPAGALAAARGVGDTSAVIVASDRGDELCNLHAASTGQILLEAQWDEVDPFGDGVGVPTTHQVGAWEMMADAAVLPEMRHEFADTRHRAVTYSLTAVSRFRSFFDPQLPPDSFALSSDYGVNVLSSAQPPPPQVVRITPAFQWESESGPGWLRRTRRSSILRCTIAKPWHVSGAGEQLAIVAEGTELPEPLRSRIARDPVWVTPRPSQLTADAFSRYSTRLAAPIPGSPATAQILGYSPVSAKEKDCWIADIGLSVTGYRPMVDLAFVTYQPSSLPGLEFSTVARADPVQTLPDRTLTCERTGDAVTVTVVGTGPVGPRSNAIRVTVERLDDALAPSESAASVAVGSAKGWRSVHVVDGTLGESIAVDTGGSAAEADRWRIVVDEFESYAAAAPAHALDGRVVFTEVIALSELA
ncbi:hypothetical protein [Micropruina sp.]|uniref:hypothetical protein n=1 Tax=Micropruina sp. TaxID=2737536 RepID=UPI0039E2DD78